jgi:hypothetical protein
MPSHLLAIRTIDFLSSLKNKLTIFFQDAGHIKELFLAVSIFLLAIILVQAVRTKRVSSLWVILLGFSFGCIMPTFFDYVDPFLSKLLFVQHVDAILLNGVKSSIIFIVLFFLIKVGKYLVPKFLRWTSVVDELSNKE